MKKLSGVVFDMDGVVIDSEITHYTAICEAMGEGATASFDQFLNIAPEDEVYAMSRMAELSGMEFENADMAQWSVRKGEIYATLVGEQATHLFLGPLNWFYRWRKSYRLVWPRVPQA